MFYLQDNLTRLYIYYKGKIILFNSMEEMETYINMFTQYSIQRILQETGNPTALMQVHQRLNSIQPIELDESLEKPPCGFINFREVFQH